MKEDFNLGKSLWLRFVRGAVAGAVASGGAITFFGENTFSNLVHFLTMVAIALITGAVTGGLLAVDKFFRAE